MSAIVSKATGIVNNAVAKSTYLANQAVYWGKVGAEVGKIVYQKEALAPPSTAQFQQVYNNALKFVQTPALQKEFFQKAANFKPTRECAVKAAVYGTQLLAFFSVGEVIGRRSLFGYPSVGGHH
ncbi:ATP synthase subunit G atp20 [Yamadazyma tenuis]|uniref:Uncharacterized protein n=1 Tax=Candida tenuis (strain ATCC 10573 / BCRC 21748 / CBS 615 / JCM 9827 / NBRC 10315 / NRRL Y-1498 / VKM Y-70) TaxID=590646 RepID=G3AZQ0_CANTC|nr:uncharacterized protein CANTEDRAFT_112514 [Yamadazyma tenuis ATCC 10573]XP_006684687.1 uncharacterized protein CANTEDRAFT_112514 [Yamadazyma tenuis ATCC 10573]EGV66112.1 hypothetical protein CANTEDRAFT_112514 [Yamadazyma tenuis ATCC 10573]EGV66113.1 hypothetical protein CANTEDRAFT_112514 [Yamadazyma tenuis ATCC 10573]WEJ96052.1 ATP synthase subunit G atp20 [Yamadazyma tenuis]